SDSLFSLCVSVFPPNDQCFIHVAQQPYRIRLSDGFPLPFIVNRKKLPCIVEPSISLSRRSLLFPFVAEECVLLRIKQPQSCLVSGSIHYQKGLLTIANGNSQFFLLAGPILPRTVSRLRLLLR